ncbi:MAG: N-acetylneuraminate synthase [Gammaproteobacteria bacterium]|nr:N-acetylneuraminate synthase [Gammaproteobacteria bacterium]
MKPKIIAEIGCNHKGELETAFKMMKIAKEFCNIDIVKFQKRNPEELLSKEDYNSKHPVPENSYGNTYGQHREFLEFNIDQHKELKKYAEKINITYSTSIWDITSAKEIVELNPQFVKIPSATNLHFDLLNYLCNQFEGEIHISTGMTTKIEIEEIVNFFEERKRNLDLVLYNCTSGYPVQFSDVCLLEISRLIENYKDRVKHIGFSGHHLGIAIDIAAITLGAKWIERHFTLDRTWKGTDHAASLEPDGMRKLSRDINNVYKAIQYKTPDILDVEKVQRKKLKWINEL